MAVDSFELEIFNNVLSTVAEEMGNVLIRSAYSPNIKERRDLSCAVFNSSGDMIAQAAHIPVHLGSMSFSVDAVMDMKISDGDIFVLNDPFRGGTHLPDITCIKPVFINDKLEFFAVSRAHHADIGGETPGSMPLSTSIHQEGIIIPPSYLYKEGVLNNELMNEILGATRNPEEREGDFKAQVACLDIGERRIKEIVGKYGISKISDASNELLKYSERIMRAVIRDIPDGIYKFTDYLDDDGQGTKDIKIKTAITVKGEEAEINFRGSSGKVAGCLNTPFSVTTSAVLYVFQCLAKDIPLNSGPLNVINIVTDEDSILNARYPSAVVGGNVETSQRVVDAVFGALANVVPEKIQAASAGTMSNVTFGGLNPNTKTSFAYYETIGGGMGGRYGMNGINSIQTHMTNTLNTPVEALERDLPILINSYSVREGSGGDGEFNGGNGIVREFQFLTEAEITIITERRINAPYGINGGNPGKKGANFLIKNNRKEKLPPKKSFSVDPGDVLRIESPGGCGWGKPEG